LVGVCAIESADDSVFVAAFFEGDDVTRFQIVADLLQTLVRF